jgi:hypothetical protein
MVILRTQRLVQLVLTQQIVKLVPLMLVLVQSVMTDSESSLQIILVQRALIPLTVSSVTLTLMFVNYVDLIPLQQLSLMRTNAEQFALGRTSPKPSRSQVQEHLKLILVKNFLVLPLDA